MKKLSVLINSMNRGGAERVVSILLEDLAKQYEVFLVVLHPGVAYAIPHNVKLFHLSHAPLNTNNFSKACQLFLLGYKYFLFCKRNKIVISLSLLNRANYINIFSMYFSGKHRVIISERGTTTEEYPKNSLKGKISRLLVRWLYPKADAIIAISKGIATDLTTVFKIFPKKIFTVYNPINFHHLTISPIVLKQESLTKDFHFIAIGRLDKSKNFEFLLQAFSQLTKDMPARLTILGDGPLRNKLKKIIVELNIERQVDLFESTGDVFSHLRNADCFISSSSHEGFSNVIVEALIAEKPVISTDCKYGPSEILAEKTFPVITHGKFVFEKYGILTPLDDPNELARAMREIMINTHKRNEYEKLGPQRAYDFRKEVIFAKYLEILEG